MSVVSQIPPHRLLRGLQISGGVGALLWAQGVSLRSRLAGDLQLEAGGGSVQSHEQKLAHGWEHPAGFGVAPSPLGAGWMLGWGSSSVLGGLPVPVLNFLSSPSLCTPSTPIPPCSPKACSTPTSLSIVVLAGLGSIPETVISLKKHWLL